MEKTVQDIMSKSPAVCRADTSIYDVARMMAQHDCGAVPVVESQEKPQPIGVITDRDIVIRLLANGKDPHDATVRDAMTEGVATVGLEMSLAAVVLIMEEHQIRRVPVVDAKGNVIGMISQADIALNLPEKLPELLHELSEDSDAHSSNTGDYAG